MGIELLWEDENRKHLGEVTDHRALFSTLLQQDNYATSVCLRFIDRFGAVFNGIQIPHLISELATLKNRADPESVVLLESMMDLARRAEKSVHTYLRFVRD